MTELAYRFPVRTSSPGRRGLRLRALLAAATSLAVAAPLAATAPIATAATSTRQITYRQWDTAAELAAGRFSGTKTVRGTLRIATPVGTLRYDDPHGQPTKTYEFGRWLSPWQRPGYSFDELIPSWEADTPGDSWVQVQVRGRSDSGRLSKWYTMANWASDDRSFNRTSHGSQSDDLATVNVDTLKARYGGGFTGWQMRVTLLRRAGARVYPSVDTLGAMTSRLPAVTRVATSTPGAARGVTLAVPKYSQMIHSGHYPEYDNGGTAWCSPTSVSMVLGRLGRLPSESAYSWVPAGHPNPWVDHAARSQYDYAYDGAGNWSFSAAYASTRADAAFVTRLRSLREAERFISAGIPLVASVTFSAGQLDGAPISSTAGHQLVIVGFTSTGDVVVNDPAARTNRSVRRVYDRGQFENVWIPRSGGLVYVIRNADQPLPAANVTNW